MASQSEGIQKLLEAEKAAQKEVDAARKEKARKLKQAKEEAKDEIKKFQAGQDAEFKKVEASIMGGSDKLQSLINAKTKKEIEEMNKRVAAQQKQVIADLVASVRNVHPELPVNFKPAIGA